MVIKEGESVVNPALYIELPPLKPKLGDRDPSEYPRGKFTYNHTRAKIAVQSGLGVLAWQKEGEDEETGKASRDVVGLFQCLKIGKVASPFEIPAGCWYFVANIGSTPLKLEIDSSLQLSPPQLAAIRKTMPQIAFTLVKENNTAVLAPTCRVGRVQRVISDIPYAEPR